MESKELIDTNVVGNCFRIHSPSGEESFLIDQGLLITGDIKQMKDPSTSVEALCKARLPKRGDKEYPVVVHIRRKCFVQQYHIASSCSTMKELGKIIQSVFDDQREGDPKDFSWIATVDENKMPPDAILMPIGAGICL